MGRLVSWTRWMPPPGGVSWSAFYHLPSLSPALLPPPRQAPLYPWRRGDVPHPPASQQVCCSATLLFKMEGLGSSTIHSSYILESLTSCCPPTWPSDCGLTWISRAVTRTMQARDHHALDPQMKKFMEKRTIM